MRVNLQARVFSFVKRTIHAVSSCFVYLADDPTVEDVMTLDGPRGRGEDLARALQRSAFGEG